MTSRNPLRIRRGNPTPEPKPRRRPSKADAGLVPVIIGLCQMRRVWAWRVNSGTVLLASGHRITLAPPGTPDVLLVLPGARLAGIEAKSATGTIRDSQRAWARVAADHGVRYAVVRSAKEAIETLDRWMKETEE